MRIAIISEIPTPYRIPVYRRMQEHPGVSMRFFFCADKQFDRNWTSDDFEALPKTLLKGWQFKRRGKDSWSIYLNFDVVRQIARGKFDLVVIGGWAQPTMVLAILTCLLLSIPYLIHSESHGIKNRPGWRKFLAPIIPGLLIRWARGFFITGKLATEYIQHFGAKSPTLVFPNTIDVELFTKESNRLAKKKSYLREELRLPGSYNFLFVGRMVEIKGVLDLLEAFMLIASKISGWGLVLVGDGLLRNEITHRIRQSPVRERLLLIPHVPPRELINYYTGSDVFILPSHDEPWGVVINEAMACGLPIIASHQVGAAGDLLVPGRNGHLFQAGNIKELAAAMEALAGDESERRKMGRESIEMIQDWGYERNLAAFEEALKLAKKKVTQVDYLIMERFRRIFQLTLLIAAFAATPLPLLAATRLAVAPASNDADLIDRLTVFLIQDKRFEVVPPQTIHDYLRGKLTSRSEPGTEGTPSTSEALRSADAKLAEGWENYKSLKIDSAIQKLEQAKAQYRKLWPHLNNFQRLLTCSLHLGIAYLSKGDKEKGENQIREMLALDPARDSRRLNKKFYTPDIIELYAKLRKQMGQEAKGRVNLEVFPPEADVWFDGTKVQGSLIKNVAEGEHFILARLPGYQEFAVNKVTVNDDNLITIRLQKDYAFEAVDKLFLPLRSLYFLNQQNAETFDELAARIGADMFLLYQTKPGPNNSGIILQGQLFDHRNQRLSSIEQVTLAAAGNDRDRLMQEMVQKLLAQLDPQGSLLNKTESSLATLPGENPTTPTALVTPPNNARAASGNKAWYQKGWVYGVIAGAAVITVGSLGLFTDTFKSSASSSTLTATNPVNP